jgi:hypothetical protein
VPSLLAQASTGIKRHLTAEQLQELLDDMLSHPHLAAPSSGAPPRPPLTRTFAKSRLACRVPPPSPPPNRLFMPFLRVLPSLGPLWDSDRARPELKPDHRDSPGVPPCAGHLQAGLWPHARAQNGQPPQRMRFLSGTRRTAT